MLAGDRGDFGIVGRDDDGVDKGGGPGGFDRPGNLGLAPGVADVLAGDALRSPAGRDQRQDALAVDHDCATRSHSRLARSNSSTLPMSIQVSCIGYAAVVFPWAASIPNSVGMSKNVFG